MTDDPSCCTKRKQRKVKTRSRQLEPLDLLLNAWRGRMSLCRNGRKSKETSGSGVNAVFKLKPPCLTPCAVGIPPK